VSDPPTGLRDGPLVHERRLLLATRARHKARELQELLDLPGVTLLTPDDVGLEGEPVEDADSFAGNAEIKARYYAERSGLPTLADDSGLEVDALGGRPGVYTRRYAGPDASDDENNARLLEELAGLPAERRTARYHCVLAFLDPADRGAVAVLRHGTFEGRIATQARGDGGFGYDPIFEPASEAPGGRTVGQMRADEKHALSHRGKAARAMAEYLRGEGW
jgi:XTP/dITP diphosphohydrolase